MLIHLLVLETKCCLSNCVMFFGTQVILECRQKTAQQTEMQKTNWLLQMMESNFNINEFSITYLVHGVSTCQKAFCMIYGLSINKVIECKKNFMLGQRIASHGSNFRVYNTPKTDAVRAWIQQYCDRYGDYVPNKDEIHLPSHMT